MNVDRRGLTRSEIYAVLKENGLKLRGAWTSRNMISELDRNGIEWGKVDRMTGTCKTCKKAFDPKGTKTGPGRDKKHCSEVCRRTMGGLKPNKSEKRECGVCKKFFTPNQGRGRMPNFCSDGCKKTHKYEYQKRHQSHSSYREKQKAKSRLKTQTRVKICKNCSKQYQRPNTWYCSNECKYAHRCELKKSYYRLPGVAERMNARAKLPHVKAQINKTLRKRRKDRRESDPIYLVKERIRCRTKAAFNGIGFTKGCKTREMIGCSWDQFKQHIQSNFLKGMKWSNRHLWHIDHIIPLSTGVSEDDLERLSHFSNLRPMWAEDNILKGDKIINCQPELTLKHE